MKPRLLALATVLVTLATSSLAQPLRVDPKNPRYLQWKGRALLVVGSAEHYGAVLNADFDFVRYLQTLGRDGLNHTRLFTGAAYVEPLGAFNIARNTLAPAPGRYLAPWARSDQPGYANGGNRFDLERWDESYFERLQAFVRTAARERVIVEINLFCPFYEDSQWKLSPFHPANNINQAGIGVSRTNVYTLDRHGGLLPYQERFVRKVVEALEPFDNLYYEICNEPYFAGVTLEWQAHIARLLHDCQKHRRHPKLISQNIANHQARVDAPLPHIDLYNFHYAAPPDAIALNRHLGLPIGDNETGFKGTNDAPYRIEAWDFLLAGGALFSHLDYSFVAGFEDGSFAYPKSQPGGGNAALRSQFRTLRSVLERLPFTRMAPDTSLTATHSTPGVQPLSLRALSQPGRAVLGYLHPHNARDHGDHQHLPDVTATVRVPLTKGRWRVDWIEPRTGAILRSDRIRTDSGITSMISPPFPIDLAFRITRG